MKSDMDDPSQTYTTWRCSDFRRGLGNSAACSLPPPILSTPRQLCSRLGVHSPLSSQSGPDEGLGSWAEERAPHSDI